MTIPYSVLYSEGVGSPDITIEVKVKISSYIAQYPVLRTACPKRFTLYFHDRHHLNFSVKHPATVTRLVGVGRSYKYPPLPIARYSFIQLSELEQRRVNKLAQGFTRQHMIRTRIIFLIESPKRYP